MSNDVPTKERMAEVLAAQLEAPPAIIPEPIRPLAMDLLVAHGFDRAEFFGKAVAIAFLVNSEEIEVKEEHLLEASRHILADASN